jgi:hypothetical protein
MPTLNLGELIGSENAKEGAVANNTQATIRRLLDEALTRYGPSVELDALELASGYSELPSGEVSELPRLPKPFFQRDLEKALRPLQEASCARRDQGQD